MRTLKYLIRSFRGVTGDNSREVIDMQTSDGFPYQLKECLADHSICHTTPSIENLLGILENGIRLSVNGPNTPSMGILGDIPVAFFAGYPIDFGSLFVATHTGAFDRPFFVYEDGYLRGYGPFRRGYHPCKFAGKIETKLANHQKVTPDELKLYESSRAVMGRDTVEHVILGSIGEFVRPRDGFGVGLIGGIGNIESDPLAEELTRRNIKFKYLPYDSHGSKDIYTPHADFPRTRSYLQPR